MESNWVLLNDRWLKADQVKIEPNNRAFLYGDAVFETMRTSGSTILFAENHFNRLRKAMQFMEFKDVDSFNFEWLKNTIAQLILKNKWFSGGRVRLTIFRQSEGMYTPNTNEHGFFLTGLPLKTSPIYPFDGKGKTLGLYHDILKPINHLSTYKTANSLLYIKAALYAKKHGYNDSFLLNQDHKIIESSNSNLMIITGKDIIAPGPESGALDGTMRKTIIEIAKNNGYYIIERAAEIKEVESADEIILCNAIQGITRVVGYNDIRYHYRKASELSVLLNEKASEYLEASNSTKDSREH